MKLEHPLRLGAGENNREHAMVRHRRVKKEKEAIGWLLVTARRPTELPITFTLTRIAPSDGLDSDNLEGAWKAGRDAIAKWMGEDDRNETLVRYVYRNERGPWGVRIEWTS